MNSTIGYPASTASSPKTNTSKKVWVFKYTASDSWSRGSVFAGSYMKLDNGKMTSVRDIKQASQWSSNEAALNGLQAFISQNKSYCSGHSLVEETVAQYSSKDFKWFTVNSSLADSIGYSRDKRAFAVQMVTGDTYIYEQVSESIFANALLSDSFGSYYNMYLKGKYSTVKL